jgi:predicted dehydrogenase
VLLRFNNGASGVLIATQVAAGEENGLRIRVYGDKGGLEWRHGDPGSLKVKWPDRPMETWRAGSSYLSSIARHHTRTPPGHPEGYIEAFANHYRNFALCLKASMMNEEVKEEWKDYPGIDEGVRGMMFTRLCRESSGQKTWIDFDKD